jgi:hypothetical protein
MHDEHVDGRADRESGIGTIYRALDRLVATHALDDAAIVVDVPVLGRQVLRAGRRPLRDDDGGLLRSPPGLYVDPPDSGDADPLVAELLVELADLGLRHDAARLAHERARGPAAGPREAGA